MKNRHSDRRLDPRISCPSKLTVASHDGYRIHAQIYDLSRKSVQVRCDLRAAYVLSPTGPSLGTETRMKPVSIQMMLPIHGELVCIDAICTIAGFRQASADEVALTLRFDEFRDNCDDQLRYYIDTSLAEEIFGNERLSSSRQVRLDRIHTLLSNAM